MTVSYKHNMFQFNFTMLSVGPINNMHLIVGLILVTLSHAQLKAQQPECDVVSIHQIDHEKEIVKDNLNSPYQMALDYDTNTLFFSYTDDTNEDTSEMFRSAYIKLKTNEFDTIPGIAGGFANAVDKNKQKVYLGGRDGVYEFDSQTHKANHINPPGRNIWQMFFKDKLYYTTYPDEKVYIFKDGLSTLVPELKDTKVQLVAADSKDNLYFKNSSGLYYYKKVQSKTILLGEYNLNSFTADMNDNLFFSTPDGFYNIDENQKVNKLADVKNVYGLVVEADNNLIYSSENSIVRLKPTKKVCFSNEKSQLEDSEII